MAVEQEHIPVLSLLKVLDQKETQIGLEFLSFLEGLLKLVFNHLEVQEPFLGPKLLNPLPLLQNLGKELPEEGSRGVLLNYGDEELFQRESNVEEEEDFVLLEPKMIPDSFLSNLLVYLHSDKEPELDSIRQQHYSFSEVYFIESLLPERVVLRNLQQVSSLMDQNRMIAQRHKQL